MLKHRDPNPLNVHQMRRMEILPPHFSKIIFDLSGTDKVIIDWIWENLEGRFFYGDYYCEDKSNALDIRKVAAFEIHGESSYFALILDTLNKFDFTEL